MWAEVQVTCFAASYAVALVLEAARLLLRGPARQRVLLGFVVAGLLAQTLFLVQRAATSQAAPLSSSFDWYLLAAWTLAAVYLYLTWYHPRQALGVFFLPLVLLLVAAAAWWADRTPFPKETATMVWGTIHGLLLLLGSVAILVGFAAGLMYLVQSWRVKRKFLPSQTFPLPSLEWLQRVNERAIVVSLLFLLAGFAAGLVLNLVSHRREFLARVPWDDPIIFSSAIMLLWLVAVALFNAFYKPARVGRKVAYLTVASFIFLVMALGVKLFVDTQHRGERAAWDGPRSNLIERGS